MERNVQNLFRVEIEGRFEFWLSFEMHDELGILTPLELFIQDWNVKPAHLALKSGYSRQHLLRVRKGTMEPTRKCMRAIASALGRLVGFAVPAADIFDLEERVPFPPYTA